MPILNNINPADLDQFTGTEAYHRNIGTRKNETRHVGVHTDGVHELYINGMAWFVDYVSLSYRTVEGWFQVWKVTPDKEGNGAVISAEDGNNKVLKEHKLDYAEICCLNKDNHLEIWCVEGVILLPSEY